MILIGMGLMILSTVSMIQHVKIANKNNVPVDREGTRLVFINAMAGRMIVLLEAIRVIFPGDTVFLITGLFGAAINIALVINAARSIRRIRLRDQAKLDELQKDVNKQMARLEHWIKEAERKEQ